MTSRRVLAGLRQVPWTGLGISLATFVILFLGGEVALRLYHASRSHSAPYVLDKTLGWRAAHYRSVDASKRVVSQTASGFRRYDKPRPRQLRILTIGDSFTQALAVGDDSTYYALIGKWTNAAVFAYGCGGYGSVQQYMILDRYVDVIDPHLIVWQFCSNDFINNSVELEAASKLNNNGMIRPYFTGNTISYVLPARFGAVRSAALQHSRLLYFIVSRLDRFRARLPGPTIETAVRNQGISHAGFRRSIAITDAVFARIRRRAGTRRILAFGCDSSEPYTQAFRQIAARHNIIFLDDVARSVETAELRGEEVRADDERHWNALGHNIVANVLMKQIADLDSQGAHR